MADQPNPRGNSGTQEIHGTQPKRQKYQAEVEARQSGQQMEQQGDAQPQENIPRPGHQSQQTIGEAQRAQSGQTGGRRKSEE